MQRIADEIVHVSVLLPKKDRERLERIAKRQKKGKESALSDVARNMLLFGMDVYEDFEKTGMVRVVEVFTEAKQKIEELRHPRQLTILDT